jgi:dihydropteroate synthase
MKSEIPFANFRGRLCRPDPVWIMGILNVTPDSFSDGGKFLSPDQALHHAEQLVKEGAHILDIGGMSSRPGAGFISPEEEWHRVYPVIKSIRTAFPEVLLSLDTWRSEIARKGLAEGVDMVNDISGGTWEPDILKVTAEAHAPYLVMHMKGKPEDMQVNPLYTDVVTEVLEWLAARVNEARACGIPDVFIDPGFGFGKNQEHNYRLFKALPAFVQTHLPVAIGISKKSMLTKFLGVGREEVSELSAMMHYQAMQEGVLIFRVHEPGPVRQAMKLYQYLQSLA